MRYLFALFVAFYGCSFYHAPHPAPSDQCTGAEVCGTDADCAALCAKIKKLGCGERWGIDPDDGLCLDLCETAEPGMCPLLASKQETCEAIDAASECDADRAWK